MLVGLGTWSFHTTAVVRTAALPQHWLLGMPPVPCCSSCLPVCTLRRRKAASHTADLHSCLPTPGVVQPVDDAAGLAGGAAAAGAVPRGVLQHRQPAAGPRGRAGAGVAVAGRQPDLRPAAATQV